MAHTNQTPNYALSQFLGTDKPAWLVDYNGDMEKIDLGLKATKDVADAAKDEADQGALDIAAVTITANSADAKATGAVSDLADAYDSTSTYNVGDFVIYSNILYRCITTITVPESFDGTHWTRTTVEEIITQINNELSNKVGKGWTYNADVNALSYALDGTPKILNCSIVYDISGYRHTTPITIAVRGNETASSRFISGGGDIYVQIDINWDSKTYSPVVLYQGTSITPSAVIWDWR